MNKNLRTLLILVGLLSFDWDGPLTLDGQDIPLDGYPRWDNPYTHVDFGAQQIQIEFEGESLYLDFQQGTREIR